MGISVETLAVAKKYTKQSIEGITGTLAGKNATIESITDITGGHRVTFKWTADNGDVRTQSMDVMDGSKGDKGETGDAGLGIKAVNINAQNHLIITYDDDSTYDAGELPGGSGEVISVNGKKGVVTLDANDVGALPDDTELFSGDYNDLDNLPDLTNFITNTVDNLVNYYKKTETYTKTEVDNIANTIKNGRFEAVATLPTTDIKTNVIYLVPKPDAQTQNAKDEYINLDGTTAGWEKIGDTEIDLSGYVTTTALNTALAAYTTTTDLTALLADKVDKVTGKGLSTNDYADADKELVDTIPTLAPISLVKDTVGWTGKNLFNGKATTKTAQGVTWTVNASDNNIVTVSGTPTEFEAFTVDSKKVLPVGEYVLSGISDMVNVVWNAVILYKNGVLVRDLHIDNENVPRTFSILASDNYDTIRVQLKRDTNNVVCSGTGKIMITDADITDPTYEPYHESVEVMYEEEIHGVNLLKVNVTSNTIDGITYTFNANNSVTLNGTSTRAYTQYDLAYKYIATFTGMVRLNGGLSENIHLYPWDVTRGARPYKDSSKTELQTDNQYNSNGDMLFYVEKGNSYVVNPRVAGNGTTVSNATMYPMLCKATIEDSTYRPYNPQAIQNQLNDKGVLGAKNLIGNPEFGRSGSYYTVQDDNSVVFNGTPSANLFFNYGLNKNNRNYSYVIPIEPGKSYIVSGCPEGGNGSGSGMPTNYAIRCYVQFSDESLQWLGSDFGKGVKITVPSDAVYVFVQIAITAGTVLSDVIFRPMIRLASDPDDTYRPYVMTNRELTDTKVGKAKTATDTKTTVFSESSKVSSCTAVLNDILCALRITSTAQASVSGAWTTIATLNDAYKPANLVYEAAIDDAGVPIGWTRIHADGKVEVYQSSGSAKTVNISSLYLRA